LSVLPAPILSRWTLSYDLQLLVPTDSGTVLIYGIIFRQDFPKL
jgi:hypothetical protein